MHFYASGCWCRREDSNLHGVLNPTRSLAWRARHSSSEPKPLHVTLFTWVHLSATRSECPFWFRVPSGCPTRKDSKTGHYGFSDLSALGPQPRGPLPWSPVLVQLVSS